jgi:hypothetical protein
MISIMNEIPMFVRRILSRAGSFFVFRLPIIAWCGFVPILLLLMGLSSTGRAATFGDFNYLSNDTSVMIFQYIGPGGNVTIPETIDGKPVAVIGNSAFADCIDLTGITIPNGVNEIGNNVFSGCKALTDITIPNSVANIGKSSFLNCSSLTNITLPNTLTSISAQLFSGCLKLPFIAIPDSVTNIGDNAFSGCASLTSVTISASVTKIGYQAFSGCNNLAAFNVNPLNVAYASVDGVLFDKNQISLIQCPTVKVGDYTAPNSVMNIGDYAFADCIGLTNIALPDAVTNIGNYAFARCGSLTSAPNLASLTVIGEGAFSDCVRLSNIEIPANILNILDRAFSGCGAVTNITISAGTTRIGAMAFFGCNSLMAFVVDPLNTAFCSLDGVLFSKNENMLIQCPGARIGNYMIPKSVISIQAAAFSGCSRLTAITVDDLNTAFYSIDGVLFNKAQNSLVACPASKTGTYSIDNGIYRISSFAFSGCSRLTNILIPNSISLVFSNAFLDCAGLTSITLPYNCSAITAYMFSGCTGLKSLIIPSRVSSVVDTAFNNCTNLSGLYFQGNKPGFLFSSTPDPLFDGAVHATVYYRAGSTGWGANFGGLPTAPWLDPQAFDFGWKQTGSSVTITNYNGSGGNAVIPATIFGFAVTSIGDSAFAGQTNLASITISGSVTNIGASVFADCTNLTSVYFMGNPPTPIPDTLFNNATNVTVYYRAGATGWGDTLAGRPTALWGEQPPYQEWAQTVGLVDQFPDASAETDDADHDGMTNLAEMQAGTDPTLSNSKLAFESVPRPNDLEDADKTPAGSDQLALYFQTVPGKEYSIQSVSAVGGAWQTETNVTATTSQKRVLVNKPNGQGVYRIVLAP